MIRMCQLQGAAAIAGRMSCMFSVERHADDKIACSGNVKAIT